jgi:hypothetical protein
LDGKRVLTGLEEDEGARAALRELPVDCLVRGSGVAKPFALAEVPEMVRARVVIAGEGFDATFSALENGTNIPEDEVDVLK